MHNILKFEQPGSQWTEHATAAFKVIEVIMFNSVRNGILSSNIAANINV